MLSTWELLGGVGKQRELGQNIHGMDRAQDTPKITLCPCTVRFSQLELKVKPEEFQKICRSFSFPRSSGSRDAAEMLRSGL